LTSEDYSIANYACFCCSLFFIVYLFQNTQLWEIRCEDKYYQLEELEDADHCTTELFLQADGVVSVGQTDGPAYLSAIGTWEVQPNTDDFRMVITRAYKAGSKGRDMGEFDYQIPRTFLGEITAVGESVAVNGVIHAEANVDFGADSESAPGYFNMIDATDVREDRRPDARASASS
jgi:hypothetical protein